MTISSMMPTLSPEFLAASKGSHTVTARADVYYAGGFVTSVPLVSGTVNVDRTSDNCRSGTAIVGDPSFAPTFVNSPLAPYGAELRLQYGLTLDSGLTEWVQLGVFTLDETDCEDSTGDLPELTFYDRSKVLQRCNFRGDGNWGGMGVRACITQLVQNPFPKDKNIPKVIFDPALGSTDQKIPGGTLFASGDGSRWQTTQLLCGWLNAEGRFGADGNFYVMPISTLIGVASPVAVWEFDAGVGGTLIQAKRGIARTGCYNFVWCQGVVNQNAPSPVGWAFDTDPRSPTFWGTHRNDGDTKYVQPFGPSVLYVQNDQLLTSAACTAYAQQQLSQVLGLARSLDFTAAPMPGLEAGDIVKVTYKNGQYEYHLLDQFSIPLGTGGNFTGTTRTQTYQISGGT